MISYIAKNTTRVVLTCQRRMLSPSPLKRQHGNRLFAGLRPFTSSARLLAEEDDQNEFLTKAMTTSPVIAKLFADSNIRFAIKELSDACTDEGLSLSNPTLASMAKMYSSPRIQECMSKVGQSMRDAGIELTDEDRKTMIDLLRGKSS